tara:strand:+ start:1133 stop:1492 length:360 start_codon:yes stop_codon:yes gene_type:complete
MMSYSDVENRMIDFIKNKYNDEEKRMAVLDWYKNFNDAYYSKMYEIVKMIDEGLEEFDRRMGEYNSESIIKKYGYDFYNYGGEDFMRSLFYIMSNFMECDSEKMTEVKYIWSGIGDWKS